MTAARQSAPDWEERAIDVLDRTECAMPGFHGSEPRCIECLMSSAAAALQRAYEEGVTHGREKAAKIAENHSPLGTGLQTRNGIAAAIRAFLARAGEGKP